MLKGRFSGCNYQESFDFKNIFFCIEIYNFKLIFMKKFSLLFGMFCFLLISCSKDDNSGSTKSPSELLQDGTWRFSDILVDGISVKSFFDCLTDDTIKFGASMATQYSGSKKCFGEPDSSNVSYSISSDGKVLTLDGDMYTIITLTSSSFSYSETDSGSTTVYKFIK